MATRKNTYPLLVWWIMFCLICIASIWYAMMGGLDAVNRADVTKLSFVIYGFFMVFTIRTGIWMWKFCGLRNPSAETVTFYQEGQDVSWFASDIMLSMGMLGTIIGFIYMLSVSFTDVDPSNIEKKKLALRTMGTGMGTALYTTACGLICGVLLKIQLFSFNHLLRRVEIAFPTSQD